MDVPEIRAMVAQHVDLFTGPRNTRHYLTVCARVCKDWHATFMPFLYRSFILEVDLCHNTHGLTEPFPSQEVLQAYGHLVQKLNLHLETTNRAILKQTVAASRNLKTLSVSVRGRTSKQVDWLSLRPLLVNNRGIRFLSLSHISHVNCLEHIAENCTSHLTILLLSDMEIDCSQLVIVLDNCRQLSTLGCSTCKFIGSLEQFNDTSRPATASLKDLRLRESSGEGVMSLGDWVNLCPHLERLTVESDMTRLGPVSQFSLGPQLSSLDLDCVLWEHEEVAEVLARCTSLKELTLERTSITRGVFGALSGHFGSLVSLDLSTLPRMEEWMFKQISENCPRLVKLYMAGLDVNRFYKPALDEQEDQPWACRENLRKLDISRIQMSLDASLNDRFMKQLMHLRRLEEFYTTGIYRGDGSTHILEPEDVPGDTPEAHLMAKLCECKKYDLNGKALAEGPRWILIKDTWPKLRRLRYERDDYPYN